LEFNKQLEYFKKGNYSIPKPSLFSSRMSVFTGLNIVQCKFLDPHALPRTIKQFSDNEKSWLTGFEKWLSLKLGFDASIFTIIQKEYLKNKTEHNSYIDGDKLYVTTYTYETIIRTVPVK